jgi:hypothetical protein
VHLTLLHYCQQTRSLDDPDDRAERAEAARLLRRMLKAGVSRYHPDPMSALEKAEKASRNLKTVGCNR